MTRLALMTVGFIAMFTIAPTVLPLEGIAIGFGVFVGYVFWRAWRANRRQNEFSQ